MTKETASDKKKLPWFRFHATDWLTSPTVLLMNRVQKSMLVDLLCYIHASGNCRLNVSKAKAMLMLGLNDSDKADFEIVWDQFIPCPDEPTSITHLKMWEWYLTDQTTYLKRQKAGRKGGKAKPKQSPSKAKAKPKQSLYVSDSLSNSNSNSNSKANEEAKQNKITNKTANNKTAQPESLQQCVEYFIANDSDQSEAEKFYFFYDSKGWKVGKNAMKRWRSAAKGWIRKNKETEQRLPVTFQQSKEQRTRDILNSAFD